MTSILEKIARAIDCSRQDPHIIITEDDQGGTRKLFISAVMDSATLQRWDEVISSPASPMKITCIDRYRDIIRPHEGEPGEKYTIIIIHDHIPGTLRLFTPEGWRTLLLQDSRFSSCHTIRLLFTQDSFTTAGCQVGPWETMEETASESNPLPESSVPPKSIVRCYASDFLPPETVLPWILATKVCPASEAFHLWKIHACRELLKCFVNELFAADQKRVGLSGKPPRKIEFGCEETALPAFEVIQETARWLFLEGNEAELKHTFLSCELAREWPDGLTYCQGAVSRLSQALESARLLYKAHVRTGGKETLKSLGELRKALAEDTHKVVQQSRELSASLWKDITLVISTLIIKYTLDATRATGLHMVYAMVFFAVALYILLSHCISVYINQQSFALLEQNRNAWRTRLYGFLDDNDYHALATTPIRAALASYQRVRWFTFMIVLVLAVFLFVSGLGESGILRSLPGILSSALHQMTTEAVTGLLMCVGPSVMLCL
ncbi:hypothetical protein [Enterobacter mori]